MKKKMIQRGLLGFPLGIAIGFVITVIISMCIGDGSFYPVTPELMDTMKNELNAVILHSLRNFGYRLCNGFRYLGN